MSYPVMIEEPLDLYKEIGQLITAHYRQPGEVEPFMAHYPNVNKLYLRLVAEVPEVAEEVRRLRAAKKHEGPAP